MKNRVVVWTMLAALMCVALALTACGGAANNSDQNQSALATVAPRTQAPTRAPLATAKPTQDTLDDSTSNVEPEPTDASGNASPTQDTLNDSTSGGVLLPPIQDGKVILPGTSWLSQDDELYQFCQNARWELYQDGDSPAASGTFKLNGTMLTLQNSADNKATNYQLAWKEAANVLELQAANATITLEYDGEPDCTE